MSYRYFRSGVEYLDGLCAGDSALLASYFRDRVAEWNHAYRHDELITVGLFDDVARIPRPVAFDLLPAAVRIAVEWQDGSLFNLAISLLGTLARASDTTEMPKELEDAWPLLAASVERWLSRELLDSKDMRIAWEALASQYRRT